MKFSAQSKSLYSCVSAVSKVINSKNALTVLNNFLFTLSGNELTIKASDMEHSLVGRIDVTDAEGEGSFCLDAHRIVDLLKEMPAQGMTFEVNDENLETVITYPNGRYDTVAIAGNEYPRMESEDPEAVNETFVVSTNQVLRGIENTIFAVGTDDLRPQMMGILWDIKPDRIVFVATDTRKLVKYTDSAIKPECECSFILPLKAANVLKNVFAKETTVNVRLSHKSVTFTSANFVFNCRLIKGMFPDYNRVIPPSNPNIVTLDRQNFINAIRRVTVFGNDGNGLVIFKLSEDQLQLRASDTSYGTSGRETVSCSYTGTPLTIGFSAPYILEIFNTISTTDVIMKLADQSRPAVCVPDENEPDTELLIILMPMNIVDTANI